MYFFVNPVFQVKTFQHYFILPYILFVYLEALITELYTSVIFSECTQNLYTYTFSMTVINIELHIAHYLKHFNAVLILIMY